MTVADAALELAQQRCRAPLSSPMPLQAPVCSTKVDSSCTLGCTLHTWLHAAQQTPWMPRKLHE
jgi:hypothetical protein